MPLGASFAQDSSADASPAVLRDNKDAQKPFVSPADAAPKTATVSALPQSWPGIKSAEHVHADCLPNPTVMTIQFEGVDYCDPETHKCGLESGKPAALFGTYVSCKDSDKLSLAIESFVLCENIEKEEVKTFGNAAVRDGAVSQCKPLLEGAGHFGFEKK
ncbi:MAG: hypothetical protein ABW189_00385 [Rickettsiales bacterium]